MKKVLLKFRVKKKNLVKFRNQNQGRITLKAGWSQDQPDLKKKKKNIYIYVGSRFSDRAHYNEFVENGSKSWALMRRRLVLGMKNTQNRMTQRPKEKGHLTRGRELSTLPASQEPLSFL